MDSGALPRAAEPRVAYRGGDKEPVTDYHRRVDAFKKGLLEQTLRAHAGNRTYAARALGLQRTYLLRLIREFGICVPIPERWRRENNNGE